MSTTFLVAAVLCIFGIFGAALIYAQIVTRDSQAPGARKVD